MLYKYSKIFKIFFWLALIVAYIAAIVPTNIAPTVPELSDKVHHIFAFVILGFLLRLAYHINYWYALVLLVAFGGFIELSQYFTPTRCAEYKDVVADMIGAFIGLRIYKYLKRII